MPGPETDPNMGEGEQNDEGRYSLEEAQEEAAQMKEKIESGEAKDYKEAEKLISQIIDEVPAEKKPNVLMALGGIIKTVVKEMAISARDTGATMAEGHEAMFRPSGRVERTVSGKWQTALKNKGLPKKEGDRIFQPKGYDDTKL